MPTLYIYAASDFAGTVPAESGGAAAGSPPFTLQLLSTAQPIAVEVDDTDGSVDEITSTGAQTFVNDVTIGGVFYPAGTTYNSAYDLFANSDHTGHKVTSLHFGGTGWQQGAVDAFISTQLLVPGNSYTFLSERTSYQKSDNTYDNYVPCFCAGTWIETEFGDHPIENLLVGHRVMTRDNGLQAIQWIGKKTVDAAALRHRPTLKPVRIRANALGDGAPQKDLMISQNHRILVRSRIAQKMFGSGEVLVAAKHLLDIDGIEIVENLSEVVYFHLLFEAHELVISNGALTESLYTGQEAIQAVGTAARDEIFTLFPELSDKDYTPLAARPLASGRRGRRLAARHRKNDKALLGIGV